jgi:hypothetical protein
MLFSTKTQFKFVILERKDYEYAKKIIWSMEKIRVNKNIPNLLIIDGC